jgi:hypothetical protein
MPSLEDLITLLSGTHVNECNKRRANVVAGHLLKSVLKDRWHQLSLHQTQQLVLDSTNRLWGNYMRKRKDLQSPKEAAKEAIADELARLEQALTSH